MLVAWIALDTLGSSRGVFLLWKSHRVVVRDCCPGSFVVSAVVLDLDLNQEWLLFSVYVQMITNCK